MKVLRRFSLPNRLAGFDVETQQHALRAKGVAMLFGEQWRAARAVVVAERIAVTGGGGVAPNRLGCLRVERLDDLLVADAVKQNQTAVADGRCAVAGADLFFPKHLRPAAWPSAEQAGLAGGAIGARPKQLRPISRHRLGQAECDGNDC